MRMNKKGFTLIEMLVVIAIIAILVAIIIPVVGSSTERAAAATDAANLRSAKAVITIGLLDGTFEKGQSPSADDCGVPAKGKYNDGDFTANIDSEDGEITVAYGGLGIDDLADIADNGKADAPKEPIPDPDDEEDEEIDQSVEHKHNYNQNNNHTCSSTVGTCDKKNLDHKYKTSAEASGGSWYHYCEIGNKSNTDRVKCGGPSGCSVEGCMWN